MNTPKPAPARSFFAELQRRHVYKVGAMYAVAGWLLVQVATQVLPIFHVGETVQRVIVLAIIAGFPVALVLAWIFDLTPQGLVRTVDAPADESSPLAAHRHSMDRRLNYLLGALLLLALGYLLLDRLLPRTATGPAAAPAATGPSIAVLPFEDMSQAGDQGYFSDGMAEELLNLLAQVPEIHVAGRTSPSSFKGRRATVDEIGRALNVGTVLEGGVRKDGDRLRVNVQLINVADGFQLWSQSYDRKLTDIFAVQDDIAGAVVDALKLKLLPNLRPSTAKHHVPAFETYDYFLLGRQLLVRNEAGGYARAALAFGEAVKRDPDYAEAWSGMAMAESFSVEENPDTAAVAQAHTRAMAAAERAVALDPQLGDAYAARGYLRGINNWDWDGAMADLLKAVSLDPGDARNQLRYGHLLATQGHLAEAVAALEQATRDDPLFIPAWTWLGRFKTAQVDYAGARLALNRALAINPGDGFASSSLATVALLQGDAQTAREMFAKLDATRGLALAEHALSHDALAKQALDRLIAQHASDSPYLVATVYAGIGERDRAFEWLDKAVVRHDVDLPSLKYDPLLRGLRHDLRFTELLRKLKLPEE